MKKVAAKHNQDSVLVKQKGSSTAKLHATRKGGLGKSKSATAGKLKAKKGEFSTQVGKKHMTYESILNKAEVLRQEFAEGKKKGLWDNIHAKRKRGEAPAKKGDKDYPKTLNVEGTSYGLYKGDGKPKGAMKNFLDKRAEAAKKKKKVKHDCSSKVKHEEYGIGDCIKEMHTLDEYGDITHYDVLFSHGVEKNVPVKNLTSLVSEMHEHYINDDKNAEVAEAKVDMKTPEYKRATVRDKRYGNPHGSHELGGGIRKDRRADHEAKRGVKEHHQKDANGKVIEHEDTTPSSVEEAKVDKGRSDYGKASIRNYRSKGPGYGEPAMFDPENKRGKLIDKRREEHKARRGVKGAKVPAYKVDEGAAWTKKAGKNKEGGLNEKGRKSYERDNPGSDLKAPSKKVGNPRRASFCARMKGMKKKLTSAKTARDPDSRINKSLRKWNCEYEPQGNLIGEEGYDRMRDDRLVKYGIGHDGSDRKSKTNYIRKPDTPEQKKRRQAASDRAYSSVVASLKKKYGDGVMTRSKKVRGGKEVK